MWKSALLLSENTYLIRTIHVPPSDGTYLRYQNSKSPRPRKLILASLAPSL